jgi:hypothetical protein
LKLATWGLSKSDASTFVPHQNAYTMSNQRFPQVRLTHPKGPSDHVDSGAGLDFYLDNDTVVRVGLLERPEHGDWVVQVEGANGTSITVEPGEGKAFVAGRARE